MKPEDGKVSCNREKFSSHLWKFDFQSASTENTNTFTADDFEYKCTMLFTERASSLLHYEVHPLTYRYHANTLVCNCATATIELHRITLHKYQMKLSFRSLCTLMLCHSLTLFFFFVRKVVNSIKSNIHQPHVTSVWFEKIQYGAWRDKHFKSFPYLGAHVDKNLRVGSQLKT